MDDNTKLILQLSKRPEWYEEEPPPTENDVEEMIKYQNQRLYSKKLELKSGDYVI